VKTGRSSFPLQDAALKELAGLKNVQSLNLGLTHVTGARLKELAVLKDSQVLDLSHTQVTDAELKELAGLKSLQRLNLHRTSVTAEGVAACPSRRYLVTGTAAIGITAARVLRPESPSTVRALRTHSSGRRQQATHPHLFGPTVQGKTLANPTLTTPQSPACGNRGALKPHSPTTLRGSVQQESIPHAPPLIAPVVALRPLRAEHAG
jgi:hypothetical protein